MTATSAVRSLQRKLGEAIWLGQPRGRPRSVDRAEADPLVADGVVVPVDVVDLDRQLEVDDGEAADRGGELELADQLVALRLHELGAGAEQLLLGVENV